MTTTSITPDKRPIKRQWLKMGCELEGGWDTPYKDVAATVRGAQGKTDGSVGDGGRLAGYMGEIITAPHNSLDQLCEDVTTLWPQHVNHTCGFHIHTSFTDLNTSQLADDGFWKYFLDSWHQWGLDHLAEMTNAEQKWFWDRLEAKSDKARRYCKREFMPEKQLIDRSADNRYTIINFVSYHKYKTVEVRFLPMFEKPALAIKAIRHLAALYDEYLSTMDFPEVKMVKEIKSVGDMVEEVFTAALPDRSYYEELSEGPRLVHVPIGDDVMYRFRGVMPILPGEPSENLEEA